jgi:acrylyl-CoA reductase (NADPH)
MEAWDRLALALASDDLEAMASEVSLSDVLALGSDIIAGRVRGRTVVAMSQ